VGPASAEKNLAQSNFRVLYGDSKEAAKNVPKYQDEIFSALRRFLCACAQKWGMHEDIAIDAFKRIQKEIFCSHDAREEALGEVAKTAQRIWTTDEKMPAGPGREFCSVLNEAIRSDDKELMAAAMPIIRAINTLCVIRGVRSELQLKYPRDGVCYRGGGLGSAALPFFKVGTVYRVPGFLATSFSRDVAERFLLQSFEGDPDLPCVLWIIHLDPRGEANPVYRCKQVNFVESSKFGDSEQEFLFAPYSVFTVRSVELSARATYLAPHVIHLDAAVDNRLESETLPLAPWY